MHGRWTAGASSFSGGLGSSTEKAWKQRELTSLSGLLQLSGVRFSHSLISTKHVWGDGGIWEERKPSYLSLRMWQIMQALNSYGRLELPREESAIKVKVKK